MNAVGGIGFLIALNNYKKAKKAYEEGLKESNNAAVLAAISQYENSKWEKLEEFDKQLYTNNTGDPREYKDIMFIPILHVGTMAIGDQCQIKPQMVIKNTGDEYVKIYKLATIYSLLGKNFLDFYCNKPFVINPKSECTLTFPTPVTSKIVAKYNGSDLLSLLEKGVAYGFANSWVMNDELKRIAEYIAKAYVSNTAQRQDIIWAPSPILLTNMNGNTVLRADVEIEYATSTYPDIRRTPYKNWKGTLQYEGAAYFPEVLKEGVKIE